MGDFESGRTAERSWTECPRPKINRDRGEPCGSAPPTPPCVRVRTRRFDGFMRSSRAKEERARAWAAGRSGSTRATRTSVPSAPASRASPFATGAKASSIWIFCRMVRMSVSSYLSCLSFGPSPVARLLCPLLTSAPRSRPLRYRSVRTFRTRRRPPEVRPTAFIAYPPHLPPRPLMAVDFAIIGSLVPPGRPLIRFLSIGSRLCYTLPSDTASRRRPCASLILRRHQAG